MKAGLQRFLGTLYLFGTKLDRKTVTSIMAKQKKQLPIWVRFSGIGFEIAAAVAGFALVGYWIDSHYGSSPKGVLIGSILGIIGGGYNLIRQSMAASQEAEKDDAEAVHHDANAKE